MIAKNRPCELWKFSQSLLKIGDEKEVNRVRKKRTILSYYVLVTEKTIGACKPMISDSLVMHLFQPLAKVDRMYRTRPREKVMSNLVQEQNHTNKPWRKPVPPLQIHEYQRKTWKTFEMERNKTEPQTVKMPLDGYTKFVVVDITKCDVHKQILGTTAQK